MKRFCVQAACFVICVVAVLSAGRAISDEPPSPTENTYWQKHSLIFATLKSVAEPKSGESRSTIVVSPQLRLSGELDPGKAPEVTAGADLKKFGPACSQWRLGRACSSSSTEKEIRTSSRLSVKVSCPAITRQSARSRILMTRV